MWDLKLLLFSDTYLFSTVCSIITTYCCDLVDPFFFYGFQIFNFKFSYQFAQNTTVIFGIKFLLCISFLILIRGGTPRYRYDYLTKLGWLKFIGLVLLVFIFSIFFIFLY